MRPSAHHTNMYAQPAYTVPQNPVQYYASNCAPANPVPQYTRSSQDVQSQPQPVYLVHQQPVMQIQYPAVVGVPTQVVGNPVPQAMAIQGVPGYAPQGWLYRPPMVEPLSSVPGWGYGHSLDRSRGYNDQHQEARVQSNWQRPPSQGYSGSGAGSHISFQGKADGYGNAQAYGMTSGNGRRSERVFETSSGNRPYASTAPARQHINCQPPPPQSSAASQPRQLTCKPCDKTFAVPSQYTGHMGTHVKCDESGCSFSASGKVVKEHKETAHSKSSNSQSTSALKAVFKISKESNDEIRAWREERKRNFPTEANIQRKKEALKGKLARGELLDEDARQRRQRLKEILAKQAELGVPVAEIPPCYLLQTQKDRRSRGRKENSRSNTSLGMPTPASLAPGANGSHGTANGEDSKKRKHGADSEMIVGSEDSPTKAARVKTDLNVSQSNSLLSSNGLSMNHKSENSQVEAVAQADMEPALNGHDRDDAGKEPLDKSSKQQCYFYQRGRCKKGSRCHFAHTGPRGKKGREGEAGRGGQKGGVSEAKRPSTLLCKLLEAEIVRDKSYILQCFRFFVNNNFLLNWPKQPSQSTHLALESDLGEDSSDISDAEVVEAPDVLLADTAIINSLLSERPDVLAKVMEMETEA